MLCFSKFSKEQISRQINFMRCWSNDQRSETLAIYQFRSAWSKDSGVSQSESITDNSSCKTKIFACYVLYGKLAILQQFVFLCQEARSGNPIRIDKTRIVIEHQERIASNQSDSIITKILYAYIYFALPTRNNNIFSTLVQL